MVAKPFQLLIARKEQNPVAQPDYSTDMRTIERWAKVLIAYVISIAGGVYASLTGPGETATPGALTQAGPLTVNDNSTTGINFNESGNGTIGLNGATASVQVGPSGSPSEVSIQGGSAGVSITSSATFPSSCPITISSDGSPTGALQMDANGGLLSIGIATDTLRFLGSINAVHGPLTVSGSRGGNLALASLLSALVNYGLIIDSTSP